MLVMLTKKQIKKFKKKFPDKKPAFMCNMDDYYKEIRHDPLYKAFYGDGTIKD